MVDDRDRFFSEPRSYFLSRLLGEVVFAESGLANTDLKWERRRTGLVVAGYAAIAAVTVGHDGDVPTKPGR